MTAQSRCRDWARCGMLPALGLSESESQACDRYIEGSGHHADHCPPKVTIRRSHAMNWNDMHAGSNAHAAVGDMSYSGP